MTCDPYDEVKMIVQDLPTSVHAFCYHDDDGDSYIVVNSRLSREQQEEAYWHEMAHISRGEMYNQKYVEYSGRRA